MQARLWDKIRIADIVGLQVISLDKAPHGYADCDAAARRKFSSITWAN